VEVGAGSNPLDPASIPGYGNIPGDINGDGVVNAGDVLLATRIVTGQIIPTASEFLRGDVAPLTGGTSTPDGSMNAGDLLLIQRKALGLVSF